MFCSRFVSYFDSMVISQSTDATQAEKRKEVEAKLAEEEKVRQERWPFLHSAERGVEQQPKIAEV